MPWMIARSDALADTKNRCVHAVFKSQYTPAILSGGWRVKKDNFICPFGVLVLYFITERTRRCDRLLYIAKAVCSLPDTPW